MKYGGIIVFAFFNRRRGIIYLIILAIAVPILVMSYGYIKNISDKGYLWNRKSEQSEKYRDENIIEIDEIAKSISSERQILTSADTIMYKKYIYDLCNHIERREEPISYSDIGLGRAEFSSKHPDWHIKSFTRDKIVMEKAVNGYCPNHYILQELDGFIAIYQPDTDSNLDIIKHTDISIEYLSPELQYALEEGLAVETLEEIENMIEDIDS